MSEFLNAYIEHPISEPSQEYNDITPQDIIDYCNLNNKAIAYNEKGAIYIFPYPWSSDTKASDHNISNLQRAFNYDGILEAEDPEAISIITDLRRLKNFSIASGNKELFSYSEQHHSAELEEEE